jgi:uncharacterized membrane protein
MEHHVTTAANASPEQVWALFVDVERWPEITKSISTARRVDEGALHVGSEAIIEQPRLPKACWRVTALEPGRSFTWETSARGITTVGSHIVDPDGQGSSITLTLRMHGPLARLLYAFTSRLSRRYLTMEMEGFRRAAESVRELRREPSIREP